MDLSELDKIVSEQLQKDDELQKLRKSEGVIRSIFDHSMDGIALVSKDGIIMEWNRGYESISGLTREEVVGKPLWEAAAYVFEEQTEKKQKEAECEMRQAVEEMTEKTFIRNVVNRETGKMRILNVRYFPLFLNDETMMGIISNDVTELMHSWEIIRENEQKLSAEHNRIKALGALINDGFLFRYALDKKTGNTQIIYVSGSFEKVIGLPTNVILDDYKKFFAAVVHPDDVQQMKLEIENVAASQSSFYYEVRIIVEGRQKWLMFSAHPYPSGDNMIIWEGIAHDVTARKEAELQLAEEKKRLQAIGDNLPDGALFSCVRDKTTDTVSMEYVSATWDKVTGSLSEKVLESFELYLDTVYPDDREYLVNLLDISRENLTQFNIEIRMLDDDGAIRWLHFIANSHVDGNRIVWDGIVHNITVRKEAEQKLAIETNRIKMLGDHIPDGCLFRYSFDEINKRHLMYYVSATWEEITGVPASEVLVDFNNFYAVVHPENAVLMQHALYESVKSRADFYYEVCISYKGVQRWLQFSSHPHCENDTWVWEGIIHDITARKEAEYQLIKEKEKAEEADKLKSAFLANMSHEIRTPLNGIIGFLEFIGDENLTPERRKQFINVINNSSAQLAKLIDDIIDISKIEAQQLTICPVPTRLNELMYDLHVFFETYLLSTNKERVTLILDDSGFIDHCLIYADTVRLRQALTNLISNAIKFTEKGFIRFGYRLSTPEQLEFVVEDSGIGMSEVQKEVVFERFRQAESDSNRQHKGFGLGLTISRNLIQLMGGDMWVESTLGEGTTFYFSLPYV